MKTTLAVIFALSFLTGRAFLWAAETHCKASEAEYWRSFKKMETARQIVRVINTDPWPMWWQEKHKDI